MDRVNLFEQHFSEVYGERWLRLRAALEGPDTKVGFRLASDSAEYRMDQASIWAARALQVQSGDRVLDLCSAPGGKALVILEKCPRLLVANEYSADRFFRMLEVFKEHVPTSVTTEIQPTRFDGNQFGLKRAAEFDRVFLDAPCSSERHWIEQKKTDEWKVSRTQQLAKRQYSLLCSALLSTRPGGTLVYATCSISPIENDGVIARLIKRKPDEVMLDPSSEGFEGWEKTEVGFQIFPDHPEFGGAGPLYVSRLKSNRKI